MMVDIKPPLSSTCTFSARPPLLQNPADLLRRPLALTLPTQRLQISQIDERGTRSFGGPRDGERVEVCDEVEAEGFPFAWICWWESKGVRVGIGNHAFLMLCVLVVDERCLAGCIEDFHVNPSGRVWMGAHVHAMSLW